jgi:hypothetical protein
LTNTTRNEVENMHEQLKAPAASFRAKSGEWLQQPRVRLGAVVAVAVAAAFIAWVAIDHGGGTSKAPGSQGIAGSIGPIGLSAAGLQAQSRSLHQAVYWAGPKAGYTYELTRTTTGRVYVRYLPPGAAVGAKGASYLIVATYPFPNAIRALKALARHGGGIPLADGSFVYVGSRAGTSVYLARPGMPYEIEIYDPSPARARSVAVSGDVRPVR